MPLNQPLLLAAVLGFMDTISHLKRGSHIATMISILGNPELSPLDMAYLYITWKIVWVMMLAVSTAQLYLALPTAQDSATIATRTAILRIFAVAWLANGIVFVKGVGVKEASPWISIACSALVWLGSLSRFSGRERPEEVEPVADDDGPDNSPPKKRTHRGKRGGKRLKAKKAGQDTDEIVAVEQEDLEEQLRG